MLFEISYEDYSVGMSIIRPDAEISPPVEDSEILADAEINPAIDDASISADMEANLPPEYSSVSSSYEAAEQTGMALCTVQQGLYRLAVRKRDSDSEAGCSGKPHQGLPILH